MRGVVTLTVHTDSPDGQSNEEKDSAARAVIHGSGFLGLPGSSS